MNALDAIHARRSVKHFDPEHRLDEATERALLTAMLCAPTSFNSQHWRFVLLKDPALRTRVRAVANDQAQVTDASLLVLFTGDTKAWAKEPARYWRNAPSEVASYLTAKMGPFHEGREALQRGEAQRSIGMAMQTLMLAAKALGLDSCPMIGFDHEAVSELVGLPPDHVIGPMVAVGRGTKALWPRPGQLPLDEVVFTDRFPTG